MFKDKILPQLIPMKAKTKDLEAYWDNPEYAQEEKIDGEKMLLFIGDKDTGNRGQGRRPSKTLGGLLPEKTLHIPHIAKLKIPGFENTVIDGEIVHPLGFNMTSKILGSGYEKGIKLQEEYGWLEFIVYDILYSCGKDMTQQAWQDRRILALEGLMGSIFEDDTIGRYLKLLPYFMDAKKVRHDRLVADGKEGSVLKYIHGIYELGKESSYLLKAKMRKTVECVIMGFEMGQGKYNRDFVGKVLFGMYKPVKDITDKELKETMKKFPDQGDGWYTLDHDKTLRRLIYLGSCSGFNDQMCEEFTKNSEKYIGNTVEIGHFGVFHETGKFRHPQFERLRPDKHPSECIWGAGDHVVPKKSF